MSSNPYSRITDDQGIPMAILNHPHPAPVAPVLYGTPLHAPIQYASPGTSLQYAQPAPVYQQHQPNAPVGPIAPVVVQFHQAAPPTAQPVAAASVVPPQPQQAAAGISAPFQLGSEIPPNPSMAQLRQSLHEEKQFDLSRYFREGWAFTKLNLCTLVMAAIFWGGLSLLIMLGLRLAADKAGMLAGLRHDDHDHHDAMQKATDEENIEQNMKKLCHLVIYLAISALVSLLLQLLIMGPALASAIFAVFTAMRTNTRVRFKHFFRCFSCDYYCSLLGLNLVKLFLNLALFFMCILPGLWFSVASLFAVPLHLQHKGVGMGCSDAISLSTQVINKHFCSMLGLLLLLSVVNFIGIITWFGVLFSVPFSLVVLCYCYSHLIGINGMPMVLMPVAP